MSDAVPSTRGLERIGFVWSLPLKCLQRITNKYNLWPDVEARIEVCLFLTCITLSNFKTSYTLFPLTGKSIFFFVMSHMASPFLWKAIACPISWQVLSGHLEFSRHPEHLPQFEVVSCFAVCVFSNMLWAWQGLRPGMSPRGCLTIWHASVRKGTLTAVSLSSWDEGKKQREIMHPHLFPIHTPQLKPDEQTQLKTGNLIIEVPSLAC